MTDDAKFCPYCGAEIAAVPSDPEECGIEPADPPDAAAKDESGGISPVPTQSPAAAEDSPAHEAKAFAVRLWGRLSFFGKLAAAFFAASAVLFLAAALFGKNIAAILVLLQIGLVIAAVNIKKNAAATAKWLSVLPLFAWALLLLPYAGQFSGPAAAENSAYGEDYLLPWSDFTLSGMVPEPESLYGWLEENSQESLALEIYETDPAQYARYVSSCIEKGFTVEGEQLADSYSAYNEAGYQLTVSYQDSLETMSLCLSAPRQYGELEWPDGPLASRVPAPASSSGEIMQNDESGFRAAVAGISEDAYRDYVGDCAAAGFSQEVRSEEKAYFAQDGEGYRLSVSYEGNSVMSVSVEEPRYELCVAVTCEENFLFSQYDVDVYLDGFLQGTLAHGGEETYSAEVTKGAHTVRFVNEEDEDVAGEIPVDVQGDTTVQLNIRCTFSEIGVERTDGGEASAPDAVSAAEIAVTEDSTAYQGRMYEEVQAELEALGFTNITCTRTSDGAASSDGEVTLVQIQDAPFRQGDVFSPDAPVVIVYQEKEADAPSDPAPEILTAENCPDLAALLQEPDYLAPLMGDFSSAYRGKTIQFDGYIGGLVNHENYTTRYDVLICVGDSVSDAPVGPMFHLTNVNFYDMHVTGGDSVSTGVKVRVTAKVGAFHENNGWFELEIVEMSIR